MTDTTILQMLEETSAVVAKMKYWMPGGDLVPSYNSILEAAKANHPRDRFLQSLRPLPAGKDPYAINPPQLKVLFGQLRLVLETLAAAPEAAPRGR